MKKVKVIFFLALFSHGSDKGSSCISLKENILLLHWCSGKNTDGERGPPEVGAGGHHRSFPALEELKAGY